MERMSTLNGYEIVDLQAREDLAIIPTLAGELETVKNNYLTKEKFENLTANGGISTLHSAIQVTSSQISDTTKFTGTGKGKLFISSESWAAPSSIVIDGKNIGSPSYTQAGFIEIEFLKNFTVNPIAGNSTKFNCVAVFY